MVDDVVGLLLTFPAEEKFNLLTYPERLPESSG